MTITPSFSFIDLFAGIGGIRIALEAAGGTCVFSSEIDRFAKTTYQAFFPADAHTIFDDITQIPSEAIPSFDILAGGFPCQPFSIAGVVKKASLGRAHGFDDPNKGNLFFEIERLLHDRRPKAFLLENVRNLVSHDRKNTFATIQARLSKANYCFSYRIINAKTVVPQSRNRIYIVGLDAAHFSLPAGLVGADAFWKQVDARLREKAKSEAARYGYEREQWPKVGAVLERPEDIPDKYILTENLWDYLQRYRKSHRARGNGFGYRMIDADDAYSGNISARYGKDGADALVYRGEKARPRRLTPLEIARMQGFPEAYLQFFQRDENQPVSDAQLYKQLGNSVAVPVVSAIAKELSSALTNPAIFVETSKLCLTPP